MKAVIQAGGLGSRMGELCRDIPKPLVEICGKSLLEHQIEALKKEGITDFVIVTGHLGQKIQEHLGDGEKYGVNISYYRESEPLGTGGALFRLGLEEDFLFVNGDLVFDIDVSSMLNFHKSRNALATVFAHPNSHPYDSLVLSADKEGRVVELLGKDEKPTFYPNLCNAGIEIVSPKLLELCGMREKADFDRDILSCGVGSGRVYAYRSAEYVHDAGTPSRLAQAQKDILSGKVAAGNRKNLQKAVFLDRDGTLNVHKGYITDPDETELTENSAKAINIMHSLGYLVIVVTNQPVIARGDCTEKRLNEIHNRLEMLLSQEGAYLDGIYYCPHHPDKGYEGEVAELKIPCSCRKPEAGMLFKAQRDFNIDLSASFMVGDSVADVTAGKKAGCTSVLIGNHEEESCNVCESVYDFCVRFLCEKK